MENAQQVRGRADISDGIRRPLRVFIPVTSAQMARAALQSVTTLAGELGVEPVLAAVHTVPYPLPLDRPDVSRQHLVAGLRELAKSGAIPVQIRLIMARDFQSAIRKNLPPASVVLLVSKRRWWRTFEQKLARSLGKDGHRVILLDFCENVPEAGRNCTLGKEGRTCLT